MSVTHVDKDFDNLTLALVAEFDGEGDGPPLGGGPKGR
jgi:hypothetical protein